MRRRAYLSTAAIAAVAGCSQLTGGSGSGGPKYTDVDEEDMLLSLSDFPDGWQRDDETNERFDAVFISSDNEIAVLLNINLHDTIESAKDDYDESYNGVRDPQEMDFADEAYWDTQNELAIALFRDSNAEGQAASAMTTAGELQADPQRAQEYARDMHDHWQSL